MKEIKLQSADNEIFVVEDDVVSMCATIKNLLKGKSAFKNSLGGQFSLEGPYVILKKEGRVLASLTKNDENEAIVTLPDVKGYTLSKVLEYCKYHITSNASEKEKRIWDTDFVQVKQNVLCELASASYYLDIKPLVNLTSRAIATQISVKNSEEIRETFSNIDCEMYAPVFANSLATRCRLQRKINKKKQQQQQVQDSKAPSDMNDNRTLDELLQFIDPSSAPLSSSQTLNPSRETSTENAGSTKKKNKKSKKNKKKKAKEGGVEDGNQGASSAVEASQQSGAINNTASSSSVSDEDLDDLSSEEDPKAAPPTQKDISRHVEDEDDLDPELQEALDKEVEEFRLKLESINSQQTGPRIPFPAPTLKIHSLVGVH